MSLQQKVSEASSSFQGKSIKCQRFIICHFIRGWYLTSLPPPPPAPGSRPPQSLFYHKRNRLVFELDLDLRKSQLNWDWANCFATSGWIAITSYFRMRNLPGSLLPQMLGDHLLHPTAPLLSPWSNLFKRIFESIFGRLRMPFSPWSRPLVTKVTKDEMKTLVPVKKWRWICLNPLRNRWDIDVLRPAHKYFPLPDPSSRWLPLHWVWKKRNL